MLSGGNDEEKSAAKLFLQRDPETDEIINGQILIDPTISSSELEKILASKGWKDRFSDEFITKKYRAKN